MAVLVFVLTLVLGTGAPVRGDDFPLVIPKDASIEGDAVELGEILAGGIHGLERTETDVSEPPGVRMVLGDLVPPVTIEADSVAYGGELATFSGRVVISRGDNVIGGDRAIFHEPTRTAEISGNVRIETVDFTATAERAAVNLDLMLARIYDGKAFFPARHYYVSGAVMERRGSEALHVSKGVFTTCDGPKPSWSLTAENIEINSDGIAESSGVTFRNAWFPMLYLPYVLVPVKNERQTGFLVPRVATSTRDGIVAALPFFWAIKEDLDLTLLPVYRSDRGMSYTAEGRYNLNAGEGIWLATHLRDRKENSYTYRSPGGETVLAKNLYWFRAQNNWKSMGFDMNFDLDLVSDPTFLYAFRNEPDGFFYSSNLFSEFFGRTVSEDLDPLRVSTFFVQKSWEHSYFRGTVSYVDNLYRKGNVDTLQNVPSLYYGVAGKQLGFLERLTGPGSGPRFGIDVQYDNYLRISDKNSEIDETGHRLIINPSVHWRHVLFDSFGFETKGDVNYSLYAPNGRRPGKTGTEEHDSFESSLSANLTASLSTTLSRVYPKEDGAILHQFTPVISLEFTSSPNQAELPYFDSLDRILNQRTLRYGFWNSFTVREKEGYPEEGANGYVYREVLRVGLFHSYEFASNLKWAEESYGRYYTSGYFDKGVGPLDAEVEVYVTPYVTARLLSSLDGRTGKFTSHDIALSLKDERGDLLSIIYDYESEGREYGPPRMSNVNQVRGDLVVSLGKGWLASYSARYDISRNRALETYISLGYEAQCYSFRIMWEDSDDQSRIAFLLDLFGLGSFGNTSGRLVEAFPSAPR
ncbi:MAG: LPS assembly protein LptD [Deltaproteobacteria bacterium]|nr:LPS assembly protein LptD [Deltaproteobacteria bacterium]